MALAAFTGIKEYKGKAVSLSADEARVKAADRCSVRRRRRHPMALAAFTVALAALFTGIKVYKDGPVKSPIDVVSAVAALRSQNAMQAARDVISLLPLADLHARSHALFYLEPSTGGAEPKITVYLLEGIVETKTYLNFSSVKTARGGPMGGLATAMPKLVYASKQEVTKALQRIGPGLSFQWNHRILVYAPSGRFEAPPLLQIDLAGSTGIKFNNGSASSSGRVLSVVDALRSQNAMQAARDVLSLLPLADLHVRNHAYFYLEPSRGGAEPKITVYLLQDGAVKDGALELRSVQTVREGPSASLPTMPLPPLVEASQQEVANALRKIGLGLSLQWDDTAIKHMTSPGFYVSSNVPLLRVSWA